MSADARYRLTSFLLNFGFHRDLDVSDVEIGDGVVIKRVDGPESIRAIMGIDEQEFAHFRLDHHFASLLTCRYLLVVEQSVSPTEVPPSREEEDRLRTLADRALLALRLCSAGMVLSGGTYLTDVGESGAAMGTWSVFSREPLCFWSSLLLLSLQEVPCVREVYGLLERFDAKHAASWRTLHVALRRFTACYERWVREDRVVDAMIVAEADSQGEITFKLAFRCASLLASGDAARVELFRKMQTCYRARSAMVHGGSLNDSAQSVADDPEPVVDVARRLLVAFLMLADSGRLSAVLVDAGVSPGMKALKDQLDAILLHSERRAQLRAAAGLATG
ncbi:MAG: hypothetical protein ACRDI2_04360 [Chloroflexota bacterium]